MTLSTSALRVVDATASGPGSAVPALVVFSGGTTVWWLRLLQPGFRHCFVAVASGEGWIIIDPLSHKTSLSVVEGYSADELAVWYESHGLRTVKTTLRDVPPKMAPLAPTTCVEAVKRVLGIHARPVITPRHLYDYLLVEKNKNLDIGTVPLYCSQVARS